MTKPILAFTRGAKPIRIIGDPDNQRPDKWSSAVFFKCKETPGWKEQFLNDYWPFVHEVVVHKEIISCSKVTELKHLGKFLCNLKCRE